MHIDHINISAPAGLLERVKTFYCEVLGLKEGFRPNFSRPGYWLYSGDHALMHLIESDAHFHNEKPGYLDHFALRSSGLDKTLQQMNANQIDYSTSYIREMNLTQVFCRDPAGNRVEVGFLNETV